MAEKIYNVLFLCTGNSARSIMAEVLLNAMGKGRFKAWSAGSHPKGHVHPYALDLIEKNRLSTAGLRSKDWGEFSKPGMPQMDFVFTVCDNAASEVCPIWPGQPMTAHWGIPDPADGKGPEAAQRRGFFTAYSQLAQRLSIFVSLPLTSLDRFALQKKLDEIGRIGEKQPVT
jgi:protein-tyrosine-phosphatase